MVVLTTALAALLCLPCALVAIRSREPAMRRVRLRRARARADRPQLRRLEHSLTGRDDLTAADDADGSNGRGDRAGRDAQAGWDGLDGESVPRCRCGTETPDGLPAIEQVLLELRRLDQQRLSGLAQQSETWARAVVIAYDRWLQVACHYLSVAHHLSCLTDIDRDIERLRVEGELSAAGLPPIRTAEH
jgi:hypothetical protein